MRRDGNTSSKPRRPGPTAVFFRPLSIARGRHPNRQRGTFWLRYLGSPRARPASGPGTPGAQTSSPSLARPGSQAAPLWGRVASGVRGLDTCRLRWTGRLSPVSAGVLGRRRWRGAGLPAAPGHHAGGTEGERSSFLTGNAAIVSTREEKARRQTQTPVMWSALRQRLLLRRSKSMPIPGNRKQARSPRSPCRGAKSGFVLPHKGHEYLWPPSTSSGAYPGAEHVPPGQGVKEQGRVVFFPSQAFHGAEPRIVILV